MKLATYSPVLAATQLRFHDVEQSPELMQCLHECLRRLGSHLEDAVDCRVVLEPHRIFVEIRRNDVQLSVTRLVQHTLIESARDAFDEVQRALTSDVPWSQGYQSEREVTGS